MDKAVIIDVIEQYLYGFKTGDFSDAKFSENMKFISPLKADPVVGNKTIRGFLKDVSSRVEAVTIHQHIVEYPFASSLFDFTTTYGDVFTLIDYFNFEGEEISLIWPCFDPKLLMAKPSLLREFLTGDGY